MRVLVHTIRKCGSTSLFWSLRKSTRLPTVTWRHPKRYKKLWRQKRILVKTHNDPIQKMPTCRRWDVLFTVIRPPLDVYPSVYFENLLGQYPYSFGPRGKKATIRELIQHFIQVPWESLHYVSYDHLFKMIQQSSGINLWTAPFNARRGWTIHRCSGSGRRIKYVVVLTLPTLAKTQRMSKVLRRVGLRGPYRPLRRNVGKQKWYAVKYRRFKSQVPSSFQARHQLVNDRILEKFFVGRRV